MHTIQEVTKTEHAGGVNSWYGLYEAAHIVKDSNNNNITSVSGHMIFGSEYAQVLSFIDSNNASYSSIGHQNEQETIPHKSGNVTQTGKYLDTVNNIVDLEGNLLEWTAQAGGTNCRVRRAGNYRSANGGFFNPTSFSAGYYPTDTSSSDGVRQSLYVAL